jgi:hypothetical protein
VHLNFEILGFVFRLGIMVFKNRSGKDDSGPVSKGLDDMVGCVRWKSRVLRLVSGFPVYSLRSPTFSSSIDLASTHSTGC